MLCDYRDFLYKPKHQDLQVYERVVPDDHRLRLARQVIDFDSFEEILKTGYCVEMGQPAVPPVIAFKLEMLKYWYNLSDREVVARAQTDLAFRYFLNLPICLQLPHFTLLTRFRGRLGEESYKQLFHGVLQQARKHGLVKDQLRLKDATHILGNISIPSTLALAAQIRESLIDSLEAINPQAAEGFRIAATVVREQTENQNDSLRLQQRIELIVDILQTVVEIPDQDKLTKRQRQKLQESIELAKRLLDQHSDPNTPNKLRSTTDPEASRGKHGVFYDGYVLDVAMDAESELITAINVLSAGGNEAQSAVQLIEQEHEHQHNQVQAISIDGAGYNGEMIRRFEGDKGSGVQGLGVTVFVPPKKDRVDVAIPASAFTVSEDGQSITCPEGKKSTYHSQQDNSVIYRFAKSTCQDCPLQSACTPKLGGTPFGRTVSKSEYTAEYERVKQRATGPEFAEVRRKHPAIERKLNECVNHHGARRARYWGRAKLAVQQYGVAMVVNTKRMIKLLTMASKRAEGSTLAMSAQG